MWMGLSLKGHSKSQRQSKNLFEFGKILKYCTWFLELSV